MVFPVKTIERIVFGIPGLKNLAVCDLLGLIWLFFSCGWFFNGFLFGVLGAIALAVVGCRIVLLTLGSWQDLFQPLPFWLQLRASSSFFGCTVCCVARIN